MSNGTKKEASPTPSKRATKPKPPQWLLDEYEAYKELVAEEKQEDTYWHTSLKRVEAALRDEYGVEV